MKEREEIIYEKYRPEKLELSPGQIIGAVYERKITTAKQKMQFKEMVASVKSGGVHQDINVKRVKDQPDKFIVIFGWMRFQAVIEAGVPKFSATVYPADISEADIWLMALTENITGVDANPLDIAEMVFRLKQVTNWHNKTVAAKFGKSEPWVSKMLKLRSSKQIGEAVKSGDISKSQAEELSRITDIELQTETIDRVKGTTVAETKGIIEEVLSTEEKAAQIEELKNQIGVEKEKIADAKKREKRKVSMRREIRLKEGELKAVKLESSENIVELTASIKEIEKDYFGSIETINEAKARMDELKEELAAIDTEKLVKEDKSLEKRENQIRSKINALMSELRELRDESTQVVARKKEVLRQIAHKEDFTNELSVMQRLYNRAEEKKIQIQHKRRDDIENFEKVKLALGEEEKKYAEKIRNLETELAELNAGLKRFGGMPLEKREEKLKRLEEKLKSLQGEV